MFVYWEFIFAFWFLFFVNKTVHCFPALVLNFSLSKSFQVDSGYLNQDLRFFFLVHKIKMGSGPEFGIKYVCQ